MNALENSKNSLQNFINKNSATGELDNHEDIPFHSEIDLLDTSVYEIHKHTVSSNIQITAVTTLCLSYACAYAGLKGCEHYVFDASLGATGKDSAFDKAYELILEPVVEMQNAQKAQYDYKCQSSDEKLPLKSFHCIHTVDATEQGIIVGLETTKAQFVAIPEVGNKLKNKEHPLMNFITRAYGKKTLNKPNYKKDLGSSGSLTINGASVFFYGNSNFQMMSKSIFNHHLVGGLFNRCILIYNTRTRPFEKRPESYDLPQSLLNNSHLNVDRILAYGKKNSDKEKPKLVKTDNYVAFDRHIYEITNKYSGTEIEYLFKRVIQNLNSIIYTFHYLFGVQKDVWHDEIQESTILFGINYMKYILEGYDALIDELIGASAEERDENNVLKLHSTILKLSNKNNTLKLRHRDIYRAARLTRPQYDKLIFGMHYKTDKKFLHVLPESSATSATCDKAKEVA